MIKRFILLIGILSVLPAYADVNMTPQTTFSGYYNKSYNSSFYKPNYERTTNSREEIMKRKSVTEMENTTPKLDGKTSMTYGQFPQHYDSSNMLHMQGIQNGMQNMFMGL